MHTRFLLRAALLSILLVGCATKNSLRTGVGNSSSQSSSDTTTFTNPLSPNTQVTNPEHGKETGLSIGALSGMNGALANGVATAYYFEDKATIVGIQLNIAAAKDGKIYTAWLQGDNDTTRIRLGNLENTLDDVRHSVRFDTKNDLRAFTNVIITLQQKSTDTVPGQIVATGILKTMKR